MQAKLSCPHSFLLPFCRAGDGLLEKVGTNPIFDRNVIHLVAQFARNLAPRLIRKWIAKGPPGEPSGVAVHPTLDLMFVTNTYDHRIHSFYGDSTAVKQWGSCGEANGEFNYPGGAAVLARSPYRGHPARNRIYVADSGNHRIQVFDIDGTFLCKWGSGKGDGQFYYPRGVAAHPTQDLIFVTDCWHQRVQVFSPDGIFIRKWGVKGSDDGQFNWPYGVAVHPTQDLIFISEEQGHRIQAFRSDGTFLFKWGSQGSADGQFSFPRHIALHPTHDLLFVTDSWNHRVQVFDLHGSFVCKWGSQGKFDYPSSVSVHHTNDVVYVSDKNCVQAFSMF